MGGEVHCLGISKGTAKGISGAKRIFCGKSLENVKLLFEQL